MGELRNVIVFALGSGRYAIELRWIREIVTLGFVTTVPTAPDALAGVINLHGAIVPVLDIIGVLDGVGGPPARQGDGALVVESDGVACALRVDQVDHVASLRFSDRGELLDAMHKPLVLLDAPALVRRALEQVAGASEREPGAR